METKDGLEYRLGIDVGSTTVKTVLFDNEENVIYTDYVRHNSDIRSVLIQILSKITDKYGDIDCYIRITGSGGISLADKLNLQFVQEVIAEKTYIEKFVPKTDVVIELGGEDAKIIYFTNGFEQRMNGICAGGTGAFIDQMASLLQTDAKGLNDYAKDANNIYKIAARCGVFAKSDIQPLINEGVCINDLSASIFQSVVNQTISGLACGRKIAGNVAFLGGPLTFLSELKELFIKTLQLKPEEIMHVEKPHLCAAYGCAIRKLQHDDKKVNLNFIIQNIKKFHGKFIESKRLEPLFKNQQEYEKFKERQNQHVIKEAEIKNYNDECYLGVDAGSTTSKFVIISKNNELLYSFYGNNDGQPVDIIQKELEKVYQINPNLNIVASCSTGYGENLIKEAFQINMGEVETIAHYEAAKFFLPNVDCIIDIGGQDMKYINIKNGAIKDIILNEACSSGCGSFIENFANSLGYKIKDFALLATKSKNPIDLGTRCTVFMNSNVKQAQKEGALSEDIAQGLAYSVVRNSLFKVIKLKSSEDLGKNIVCQGGTFYNDSVLRAFEKIANVEVVRPNIAGLMGAFGAALIAKNNYKNNHVKFKKLNLSNIINLKYTSDIKHCNGCNNNCRLSVVEFSNGNIHVSGNRCEKGSQSITKKNTHIEKVPNLYTYKKNRVFNYKPLPIKSAKRGTIGIPRVLNIYENYPFWAVFFKELGFRVILSPFSSEKIYELGMETIPSESECYPAKLVHGHIEWLISKGINNIFYPCVYHERNENENLQNYYNCPMVITYPDNINNNVYNLKNKDVNFINPYISLASEKIISKRLIDIMKKNFKISAKETSKAVKHAYEELINFKEDIKNKGLQCLKWLEENDKHAIVLAGRPYHIDPEINHGIPEMIQSFGYAVLTEDSISELDNESQKLRVTNQWVYHSRLYRAANIVSKNKRLHYLQLNSFGCGVDAITIEQTQEILEANNKLYSVIKIDEINNLASARIRVRSLIAAIKQNENKECGLNRTYNYENVEYTKQMNDNGYTIFTVNLSPFHFNFLKAIGKSVGYKFEMMNNDNKEVKERGLQYINNDICYPATIIIGQIIDILKSNKYDTNKIAFAINQTGGGCRASNYLGLIQKAVKDSGFGHVPVISFNLNGMTQCSGFKLTRKFAIKLIQACIFGDILMKIVLHTRSHELIKNQTNELYNYWFNKCSDLLSNDKIHIRKFYKYCFNIIDDFDNIEVDNETKPVVAIVGELLVKFMPFGNNNLVKYLESNNLEATIPPFITFWEYCLYDDIYRHKYLGGSFKYSMISKIAINIIDLIQKPIFKKISNSKNFCKDHTIWEIKENAKKVIQIGAQSGEGWLLSGEIVSLVKDNINNLICVQPFGCLPNHVVGKGIFKKIKDLYPNSNLVAIDYDTSASEVNQVNRIKLMMENIKNN